MPSNTAISRLAARVLRHEPARFGLALDDGWVPVDALVAALQRTMPGLDRAAVEAMVAGQTKIRYEIAGDRIRARYGHSTDERVPQERRTPPAVLYHGTAPRTVGPILEQGLRPMARQYVHLTEDRELARATGARKAANPVVLAVDAAGAAAAGHAFYLGTHGLWLADAVPPGYLRPTG